MLVHQPLVRPLFANVERFAAEISEPDEVSRGIYRAARDGSSRLRCLVGVHAETLIATSPAPFDPEFLTHIQQQAKA